MSLSEVNSSNHGEASSPGLKPRRLALEVIYAVGSGTYADVALDRVLSKVSLSSIDRGLVMELSYGVIRQRKWLDCWVDCLGKLPAKKQPPQLRWLLHLGLYQIFKMERIPPAAAVNTSVELAKLVGIPRLAPVVNAILRAAIRAKDAKITLPQPGKFPEKLAQEYSLPFWLVESLITWKGNSVAENIAQIFNESPALDLRINRMQTSPDKIKELFNQYGLESTLIKDCPDGLQVCSRGGDIRNWPGYKDGLWCVQDRSAQWVAPLLDPQPGDRILDACAAPGGKATHLAELVKDCAEIWAVDRSKKRLDRLMINARRLGLKCLKSKVSDSNLLVERMPSWRGSFQRILIDAPCSGLGTLARHPDARWRITPKHVEELVCLQADLLDNLLPLLKSGGRLVYATCTIHPSENSDQISSFLKRHPELSLREERQIWPIDYQSGDGFYSAVMDSD